MSNHEITPNNKAAEHEGPGQGRSARQALPARSLDGVSLTEVGLAVMMAIIDVAQRQDDDRRWGRPC